MKKGFLFILFFSAFQIVLPAYGMLSPEGEEKSTAPSYAPGRLIVKLKEGTPLSDLDELNRQMGVQGTEELFPKAPSPQERLEELRRQRSELSSTDHPDWYWWRDQESSDAKDYAARVEKEKAAFDDRIKAQEALVERLNRRQARAPDQSSAPSLQGIYVLKTDPAADIAALVETYQRHPSIQYAQPDYRYQVQLNPNDPYADPDGDGRWTQGAWKQGYEDLWGIRKIQADRAWDITRGEGILVAVIDTGVDYAHPDLAENIWRNEREVPDNGVDDDRNGFVDDVRGWDFTAFDNDPRDEVGHGTHVAGTIAAVGNNRIGVVGVAPAARILPVQGLDNQGGFLSDLAQCLRYAADQGADVLSNSWGPGMRRPASPVLEEAVRYAVQRGCLVVFAAGNSSDEVAYYSPANMPEVISVAASTPGEERTDFSNYGDLITVSAPGGGIDNELGGGRSDLYNILSAMPDNSSMAQEHPNLRIAPGYYRLAGTSMACPHVSGVVALMLAQFPHLTAVEIRQRLIEATDPLPVGEVPAGIGRVNAYAAVSGPAHRPLVIVRRIHLIDEGDGDRIPEPGEVIRMEVDLENRGTLGSPVQVTAETSSLAVESLIPPAVVRVPELPPQGHAQVLFRFRVGVLPRETRAVFTLITETGEARRTHSVSVNLGIRKISGDVNVSYYPGGLSIFSGGSAMSGDRIAWGGWAVAGQTGFGRGSIHLLDLAQDRETVLASEDSSEPVFVGNQVVFTQARTLPSWLQGRGLMRVGIEGGASQLLYESRVILDLNGSEQGVFFHDTPDHPSGTPVSEEPHDLAFYSFRTGFQRLIQGNSLRRPHKPASAGSRCVWLEKIFSVQQGFHASQAHVYDLSTQQDRPIFSEGDAYDIDLSGDRAVARVRSGGKDRILLHDFGTGEERQIGFSAADPAEVEISGNRIAWLDHRSLHPQVYLYDLQTDREIRLSDSASDKQDLVFEGDRLLWLDFREGDPALYLMDVSKLQEGAMPIGYLDGASGQRIFGWAVDPDHRRQALEVEILVDGQPRAKVLANRPRPDLISAGIAPNATHGFEFSPEEEWNLVAGRSYRISARAIDPDTGSTVMLQGERSFGILNQTPVGYLDGAGPQRIFGWTVDPNHRRLALEVEILVDGQPRAKVLANRPRPDLMAAGIAPNAEHGFEYPTEELDLLAGRNHRITARAIDPDTTERVVLQAEKSLFLPNLRPRGYLDGADRQRIFGWAVDMNARRRGVEVEILVDGQVRARVRADQSRPDLVAAGIAPNAEHGYEVPTAQLNLATQRRYRIEARALDADSGERVLLEGVKILQL